MEDEPASRPLPPSPRKTVLSRSDCPRAAILTRSVLIFQTAHEFLVREGIHPTGGGGSFIMGYHLEVEMEEMKRATAIVSLALDELESRPEHYHREYELDQGWVEKNWKEKLQWHLKKAREFLETGEYRLLTEGFDWRDS